MHWTRRIWEGLRRLVADAEEGGGIVAAAPAVPVREVIRRFWPHARPYRRWLPLVLLVLVALGPASAASSAGRRWVATITVFSRASSRTLSASQD